MTPDEHTYRRLVEPHRAELHAHCYRMLGSLQDADDALQEALLRAWRGLPRFEGRSSLRSWLYTIATNICLRAIERRREIANEYVAAWERGDVDAVVAMLAEDATMTMPPIPTW
jgi:RNA polymerase sigma factor (sigma-70 family)